MWSICKKDLHQFFSSLTGYLAIVLFLLVNGLFLFVLSDSNLFDFGYASLDQFFDLSPWVLMFLVPAIAMRTLSDEFKTGTFEILQTKPLSQWQLVMGKYLSVLFVLLLALLPTFLYVATIKSLSASGSIDAGGIMGSYIGLFFLAAVFAAIGLCCSASTNNAVIAFLFGTFLCLVAYYGFTAVSRLPFFIGSADYYIEMLGIDFHYKSLSRGVLDTRDVVYFIGVIFLFLFITKKSIQKKKKRKTPLLIILPILLLLNWLASVYHFRIDLTNEKRFTLSTSTKKILKDLDNTVQIDVFLKGEFPSGFKRLANSTRETLQEFKEIAGPRLQFNFISPDEAVEGTYVLYSDTLAAMGMFPINLKSQLKEGEQQQFVYPIALVHYNNNVLPIDLYSGNKTFITPAELNSAEALMEYKFANAIHKLSQKQKPLVAYSSGNGEPIDYSTFDLVENMLKKDYQLFTFNLNTQAFIPDTFQLLMIVKPTLTFTDQEKLKIDQFVMKGGKLLLFIDQLEAEVDSLRIKNEVIAYDRGLVLNDLLFKYGTRINNDLVMDLQCDFLPFDVNGNGQFEFLHWNYFPLFETHSNHPINKNIGLVSGRFVNSMDTIEADGIKKTILLSSSTNARTIGTPALISGKENVNAPEDAKFKKANIPVAVLLEGKFESLYKNRVSKAMLDTLQQYSLTYLPNCIADNKIIVVADGDVVLNSLYKNEPLPMGVNPLTVGSQYQYQFANKEFLQNCLDYLIDQSGLSAAKGKDYTLRVLDPVKVRSQKKAWQLINIVLPIIIVILFALIYQWLRKRKYTL